MRRRGLHCQLPLYIYMHEKLPELELEFTCKWDPSRVDSFLWDAAITTDAALEFEDHLYARYVDVLEMRCKFNICRLVN